MNYTFFKIKVMTGIIFLTAMLMLAVASTPSWATEGFSMSKTGRYEWQLKDDDIMIINTAFDLMNDKERVASTADQVEKYCNNAGKSVYGQLMKLREVSRVIVSNRQIAVRKYGFPKKWDGIIPDVLSVMDGIAKEMK